ncbi:PREDICTED: cytochrome c oxidase subunit 5A, mitochondrial, partial [Buceros rhinoceros silvestris]|uniref:cytochrome c oxidase subunit 5A, mitochondrial n=1 Tax=Buceros rhinoceros silvestris TaxID=175836 RepID=UPI0005289AB9
ALPVFSRPAALHARCYSHGSQESDEEFDARWVTYFNKPDIDAWELRKGKSSDRGDKAGPHKEIYPYVIQELRPTLSELGISTPEELGLDKA